MNDHMMASDEYSYFDDMRLCIESLQDEELVVYAKQGSQRATEALIKRYRSLVEMKARSYFLMGADHEDVVQEGLIGLYKAIRDYRYDRLCKFRHFAELCVTRQIISAVKAATRQKHLPLNEYISICHPVQNNSNEETDSQLAEILPDPNTLTPEQWILECKIPQAVLRMARELMSELEQRVLDCYLEGLSYREMSERLNRHTKCIDNAIQRIKKKIIQVYQDNYGENSLNGRRTRRTRIAPELEDDTF